MEKGDAKDKRSSYASYLQPVARETLQVAVLSLRNNRRLLLICFSNKRLP